MRILLVHNYYQQRGGEDIYFDTLVDLLRTNGHTVKTFTKKSASINSLRTKIQTVFNMFSKKDNQFENIIATFKPDIVHINNLTPLISPYIITFCKNKNIPIVQTVHIYRYMCPKGILFREGTICELCVTKKIQYPSVIHGCYHGSKFASFFLMLANIYHRWPDKQLKEMSTFIFPTEFTKNYYYQAFPFLEKKGTVIKHSVEIKPLITPKDIQNGYFLYVGRLSEEKGILQLIEVFKKLPHLTLIIIGDGPLRDQIENKKTTNIQLTGYLSQEEKYGYIKNAFFTIIPSLIYEQGPLVLFESFANGTPVITPYMASFKEHVQGGVNGLFFKFNSQTDLKKIIMKASVISTEDLNSMRKRSRATYRLYNQEQYYKKLVNVYNTQINEKSHKFL